MNENAGSLDALLDPLTINGVTIANRIVMSPMAALETYPDGRPSEQTIAFLAERAKGGVGLIILGGGASTTRAIEEAPFKGIIRYDGDQYIPDLKRVVDAVHAHGTPIFAEMHGGFGTMAVPSEKWPVIAASPRNVVMKRDQFPKGILVPADRVTAMPREATVEEIRDIERQIADSAARAYRAGFDGVEIAAMMSYFLSSFLSPTSNVRTDEYGGSAENRARILINIIRQVREQTGPSYPIGLRITASEHVDGGQGPEGYSAVAQAVEREAGLDYVALTDGTYASMLHSAPEHDAATIEHGEAQIFRAALSYPLFLGSIHDPHRAAQAIADGHGDAIMFARQMLADPQYANKVRDGRASEIVQCDRNNYCMRRLIMQMPVRCTVNPRMGRESRLPGSRPPRDRILKAPIEKVVLAATGSERLMKLASKLPAKKH